LIENNCYAKTSTQDVWNDNFNFKQLNANASKRFNARYDAQVLQQQQPAASVWPPMLQPNNFMNARDVPHISCKDYTLKLTYNQFTMIHISFVFQLTVLVMNI